MKTNNHAFPVLAMMACNYFAVQGSAVPCKRIFSSSRLTDTHLRNNLTQWNFGDIQLVKAAVKKDRARSRHKAKERKKATRLKWAEQEKASREQHSLDSAVMVDLT